MPGLPELKDKISRCQGGDRHRLRRALGRLRGNDDGRAALERSIDESIARRERRLRETPSLVYPGELPVVERRGEIAEAIAKHPVVIICGETGSGKTTQIPKICLSIGRGVDGLVGHTQPRRLAARAVATRIAEEMNSDLGAIVGYQTRFNQRLGDDNRIKVMTDGILLAEIQRDRWLNHYDTIIIDEAHERSLNIDFLLGYLKQLVARRPDLKLIITSATLDIERIASHFSGAPVLDIAGRTYPVDVRYRSLEQADADSDDVDVNRAIDNAIDELIEEGRGDVLVFLPGEREIRDASQALKGRRDRFDVHPLYARLGPAEQQKIFQSGKKPRIILATNVAETSLTVPGIRYVIDTGTARISRYSWKAQIQRLPVEKISQASAAQRAGRCGRTGPGICIRLYSEDDFGARDAFTQPEIQRTNLAAVILQMASLKLGTIEDFPFIDRPDRRLVRDGFRLLRELEAVGTDHRLSATGRALARLPIDPRLGRMLLAADEHGAVREVLVIVTALAVGDPRDRPFDKQQAADQKHARFADKRSDFTVFVALWRYLDERAQALSQSALRRLCRDEFISFRRYREWRDLHRQLTTAVKAAGLTLGDANADYDAIHRSLLAGLLDHIGYKSERGAYTGSRNRSFFPFPGSGLHAKPPKWVMAAEITETSRVYARTIAGIDPRWIEQAATHLLKRTYSEPHWQRRKARVGGYEKTLLNGLVINPKRNVDYANIDPVVAREIFIRHALVLGEWNSRIPVVEQNRQLVDDIEDLEARTRRRDMLVSEEELYAFYEAKCPPGINAGARFAKWVGQLPDPSVLRLEKSDVLRTAAPTIGADAFPDRWRHQRIELPLSYRFEPGAEDDGVTLTIPLALLGQIDETQTEWLVPGMREQKITALLRALPKRIRKHFIPVPDFARAATEALESYRGDLRAGLGAVLLRMTGVEIPESQWNTDIEPHLRLRFVVRGEGGVVVASGRDLDSLRQSLEQKVDALPPSPAASAFERDSITEWDFGVLPEHVVCDEDGFTIERYPALAEENGRVALRLYDDPSAANRHLRGGLARLWLAELKPEQRYLAKNLPDLQRLYLLFSPLGKSDELREDIFLTAVERCFLDENNLPRDRDTFEAVLKQGREGFVPAAIEVAGHAGAILTRLSEVRARINGDVPMSWIEAVRDVDAQVSALVYPGFLRATPAKWLERVPRYFQAVMARLDKLDASPDRDRLRRSEIEPLFERLRTSSADDVRHPDKLLLYKWQLEELRVSLFAQEIGAQEKVSVKRLDKLWASIDV